MVTDDLFHSLYDPFSYVIFPYDLLVAFFRFSFLSASLKNF